MANQALQGRYYPIEEKVMEHLHATYQKYANHSGTKGVQRLKGLVERREISYEQLKRIKNYFDHVDPNNIDQVEFDLNGGKVMNEWVNNFLNYLRRGVSNTKDLNAATSALQTSDVSAPDVNPEKKNNRGPMDTPDLMTSNDLSGGLMEQINKMKGLIKNI